jgi:site-specific recombinase XerD
MGRSATGCSQAAEQLRAAYQWQNSGLVFSTELGTLAQPRNILRTVETAAAKAGMEGVGVHTLRHSAAAARLVAGVHIKAVADLLGHSPFGWRRVAPRDQTASAPRQPRRQTWSRFARASCRR